MLATQRLTPLEQADPKFLGYVALKGFFGLAKDWQLTNSDKRQLLGGIPESTFFKYQKLPHVALSRDTLERISLLMGIQKSLLVLLDDRVRANGWIKQPNKDPMFNGRPALEFMLAGSLLDIASVRDYVDAWRG